MSGLWSMLAVGLFGHQDHIEGYSLYSGLLHGGGFHLMGVQLLASVCCIAWAILSTALLIFLLSRCIRFR